MTVSEQDLEKMNDMIEKGATIASVAKIFGYDYCDVYSVVDYSLRGKKTSI